MIGQNLTSPLLSKERNQSLVKPLLEKAVRFPTCQNSTSESG